MPDAEGVKPDDLAILFRLLFEPLPKPISSLRPERADWPMTRLFGGAGSRRRPRSHWRSGLFAEAR
jgi:hypothetical protein